MHMGNGHHRMIYSINWSCIYHFQSKQTNASEKQMYTSFTRVCSRVLLSWYDFNQSHVSCMWTWTHYQLLFPGSQSIFT